MRRICFIAAVEATIVAFMIPHLKQLQRSFCITVVCSTGNPDFLKPYGITARVIPVNIARNISIFEDIRALLRLIGILRTGEFSVVHTITPKAGLIGMLSAFTARIPIRIHCFTGQVWVSRRGQMRHFLKMLDTITAMCATCLLADSNSQKEFLVGEGVAKGGKISVLAHGSVCGVDISRFTPNIEAKHAARQKIRLPDDAFVFLFIGRLNQDKGVLDLAAAFSHLKISREKLFLVFAGTDEESMQELIVERSGESASAIRFIGHTDCPEKIMAAADVLCLPSYREGFGMVIIEAAATGLPAVASRIYGITDAVLDGETGLLHEPGNIDDLAYKMTLLATDRSRCMDMGQRARDRVLMDFSQELVVKAMQELYAEIQTENMCETQL